MQLLLLLLLDLYPVKMNTSQNPPSLLFCESGCTLTSCTSHSKGSKWTSKKGEGVKKKTKNSMQGIYVSCANSVTQQSPTA